MAIRIRKDGSMVCAAMYRAEPGDTYIDDGLHYILSVEKKVLVSEPHELHQNSGKWWWAGNVPPDIVIDNFSKEKLFVVRLYDGFDNLWMDVSEHMTYEEARKIWNDYTKDGTERTKFEDIDYYEIFPADTKMLFS